MRIQANHPTEAWEHQSLGNYGEPCNVWRPEASWCSTKRKDSLSDGSSLDRVFKAYDVCGLVPDELSPALVHEIGAAFAGALDLPGVMVTAETLAEYRQDRLNGLTVEFDDWWRDVVARDEGCRTR